MKGLILKDLYSLSSYWKSLLFILIIFLITATWQSNYSFFASMTCIIIMSSSFNTFSYDDFYHWNEFSITLPMPKSQIIKAKYATILLLGGFGILISIVYYIVMGIISKNVALNEFILTISISILFSCYFISVCVPMIYKFGHEKMRIYMALIVAVPALLGFGVISLFADRLDLIAPLENILTTGSSIPFVLISALVSCIFLFVSYKISVHIFEQKEF